MEPRDVVQAAIDAYHDLDRCLGFYAPDVVVKLADGTIVMDGAEAVRAKETARAERRPAKRFEESDMGKASFAAWRDTRMRERLQGLRSAHLAHQDGK